MGFILFFKETLSQKLFHIHVPNRPPGSSFLNSAELVASKRHPKIKDTLSQHYIKHIFTFPALKVGSYQTNQCSYITMMIFFFLHLEFNLHKRTVSKCTLGFLHSLGNIVFLLGTKLMCNDENHCVFISNYHILYIYIYTYTWGLTFTVKSIS